GAVRKPICRGNGWRNSSMTGFPTATSGIHGPTSALTSHTQGGSRVPELGPLGSMRGARSNARPYREQCGREIRLNGGVTVVLRIGAPTGAANPWSAIGIEDVRGERFFTLKSTLVALNGRRGQ